MAVRAFVLAAMLLFPLLASAQSPAPFPEFEAKRVKPPVGGSAKRITIQIEPQKTATDLSGRQDRDAPEEAGADHAWFWDQVSEGFSGTGPGRLEPALEALSAGPVAAPRLQLLQDIAQTRGVEILIASAGSNVSPALVLAVIAVESGGDADAVSSAGALGLMQLMPDTAARFGIVDPLAPAQNIKGGIAYLDWLMAEFGGDPLLVLAGYNAGAGALRDHEGVPPFAETRGYVPKVLAAYQVARGLCMTPPEMLSDGCVFRLAN